MVPKSRIAGAGPIGRPMLYLVFAGTFEQVHDFLVRDLMEVSVPEADGPEVVGYLQADQLVGLL